MVEYRIRSREASGWSWARTGRCCAGTLLSARAVGAVRAGRGRRAAGADGCVRRLPCRSLAGSWRRPALLAVLRAALPEACGDRDPAAGGGGWGGRRAGLARLRASGRLLGMVGGLRADCADAAVRVVAAGHRDAGCRLHEPGPGVRGAAVRAARPTLPGPSRPSPRTGDFVVTDEPEHAFLAQSAGPAEPGRSVHRAGCVPASSPAKSIMTAAEAVQRRAGRALQRSVPLAPELPPLAGGAVRADQGVRPWAATRPRRSTSARTPTWRRRGAPWKSFIQTPTAIDFGGSLRLTGYSLDRQRADPQRQRRRDLRVGGADAGLASTTTSSPSWSARTARPGATSSFRWAGAALAWTSGRRGAGCSSPPRSMSRRRPRPASMCCGSASTTAAPSLTCRSRPAIRSPRIAAGADSPLRGR